MSDITKMQKDTTVYRLDPTDFSVVSSNIRANAAKTIDNQINNDSSSFTENTDIEE